MVEQGYLCHCNSHWSFPLPFIRIHVQGLLIPQTTSSSDFREDPVAFWGPNLTGIV